MSNFGNHILFVASHNSIRRRWLMGNPKKDSKHFNPNHIGTKSRAFGGNKGKQMQDQTSPTPQVIQTKGE